MEVMIQRWHLLRVDYAFAVIVPCLLALYVNHLSLLAAVDILLGFFFFTITGNTLNDLIDSRNPTDEDTQHRLEGFRWKEIATICIMSFLLGFGMFLRMITQHWITGVLLGGIIILVVLYCLFKRIPIVNQILLAISHILLPYLMIKIDADQASPLFTIGELLLVATIMLFAIAGQTVHEVIDGDAITRWSSRFIQRYILVCAVGALVSGLVSFWYLHEWFFFPFFFLPCGIIYIFRHPTHPSKKIKDIGIILGNLVMIYFLGLQLIQEFSPV